MWRKTAINLLTLLSRHSFIKGKKKYQFNFSSTKSNTGFIMKLDDNLFKSVITEEVLILKKLFDDNHFELRIAGGAVRDLLSGIPSKDLDFATTATPDEMQEMFNANKIRMINLAGIKHGTITARINDKDNFEITTLRIDKTTDGRHAEVEFTKDWKLDANRRDLTINSMFLGLDGTLYDYFQGYEHLKARKVVFVGDAATRIKEDYLRILRYFRFFGRIGERADAHDGATLDAIKANAANLNLISGERIWQELNKIVEGRFGAELVKLIVELGLGPYIGLPEKCTLKEFVALQERIKQNNQSVRAVTLLCGLFESLEHFLTFHQRCKLSGFDRDLGVFIMQHRDMEQDDSTLKPYQMLLLSAKNKQSDASIYIQELLKYQGKMATLNLFLEWKIPKFPVNGNMLRERVQTTSGRQVGALLHQLQTIWCEKDFQPTPEELLDMLPELLKTYNENKKLKTC